MQAAAVASLSLVSACSGDGGGSGSGSSGQPIAVVPGASPGPTAAAGATPTPSAEDMEYARSNAAVAANADAAYRAGFTGRGIRIAVIDIGVNPALSKFAGRTDPASRDIAGDRGLVDLNGHGTYMASIALAARDSQGMHGLAYDATLISFNISTVGSCTPRDCPTRSGAVVRAIDAAVQAGARVINMSFTATQTSDDVLEAVGRAAAAGVVMVISAGNEKGDEPLLLSRTVAQAGAGCVIIAGGHDLAGRPYADGNRAGTGSAASSYLAALAVGVTTLQPDGTLTTNPGTSPAAAAISGAAALIAQARPELTAPQIVALLLDHAADAGAPGRDPVYGNGILNVAASLAASRP